MTPEHWAKVRALLEKATDLPESEREAFLNATDDDPELIAEVRRLLSHDQQASAAFSIETWQGRAERTASEVDLTGVTLGNYRLLRELGRGGMGAVYLAERGDGTYYQTVAVKILQENIFTVALAERFRQERQILARLTHPGVARLIDGGILPDGRPYLVLEYVDGIAIDRYCNDHGLSLEARLRLFVRVAEVVQSAHQQLILHLDLKPANILVTAAGDPRLLDFGLARILSEADARTEATVRLLTPRYASPEQASGGPLGVASDVFSLGTLLYYLLTGTLPYPIEHATPLEAVRILNDTAPIVPSKISPALKGDLDTILLQALRKEPERRYPTVAAFGEDVQRALDSRPVLAHKDSFGYRTGKFFRRNRLSVAVSAVAFCAVVASVVAVAHSASIARYQRAAAERRLHDVQDLARFYVVDLFVALNDIPGTLRVRKQMTQNAVKYLQSMTSERDGDPKFSMDLANGFFEMAKVQGFPNQPSLGDLRGAQSALNLAREMVELHAIQVPTDTAIHGRRGLLLASQANITNSLGDVGGAVAYEQKAWDEVQPVLKGPKSNRWMQISTYCFFASVYLSRDGQFNMAAPDRALIWINRAEALLSDLGQDKPEFLSKPLYITQLAQVRFTKADILGVLHRDSEARTYFMQALRDVDAQNTKDSIEIAKHVRDAHLLYAEFLLSRGDLAGATAVSSILRPPEVNPDLTSNQGHFDLVEYGEQTAWWTILSNSQGRRTEAVDNMHKSLKVTRLLREQAPEDQVLTGQHVTDLVRFAEMPGVDPLEAHALFEEAIVLASAFSQEHPDVLGSQILEAHAHLGLAHLAEHHQNSVEQKAEQKLEAGRALILLEAVVRQRPDLTESVELTRAAHKLGA
jgi:hypothetical protein